MKNQNSRSNYLFPIILVIAIIGLAVLLLVGYRGDLKKVDDPDALRKAAEKNGPAVQAKTPILEKSAAEISESAESQIDKKAVLQEDVEAIREKSEQQAALPQPETNIDTFAPISQEIYGDPGEHPADRLKRLGQGQAAPDDAPKKLPPKIYAVQGKSNTTPISRPAPPVAAPDPYAPPPIQVNPERVPRQP